LGKKLKTDLRDKKTGDTFLRAKRTIKPEDIEKLPIELWAGADLKASMDVIDKVETIVDNCSSKVARITEICEEKIRKFLPLAMNWHPVLSKWLRSLLR